MLTPREIAETAVRVLSDKQAKDIQVLRTTDVTVLADYFVICTATSSTHVKTLTDEVDGVLSNMGEPPLRREGYRGGRLDTVGLRLRDSPHIPEGDARVL